jgi:rubrerythrin
VDEVAAARSFDLDQTILQVFGVCEECRTGKKTAPLDGAAAERVFARDALRIAIATEKSGLEFYTRAAAAATDVRGRGVFQRLAAEEGEHLGTLEQRYADLIAAHPGLESRPTFLFFKGAAAGLFAEGAEKLRRGVNDLEALLIGIKCERGSHRFFKRYGDRFEDSEGKQIFLEFAEEERLHLELLIGEYRELQERQGRKRATSRSPRPASARAPR